MSIIISSISLVVSLLFICDKRPICIWIENICIGVFASGILMTFSSVVGYIKEEKHLLREYHWKLSELKECAVELVTIPVKESTIYDYYCSTRTLNKLLNDYFSVIDTDFWCHKRNKIQKILEIHTKLEQLKHLSSDAMLKMCEYRCGTLNSAGEKNYPFYTFKEDIKSFINAIDNYDDSGMMLPIWLETKEREYGEVVFPKDKKE